MNQEQTLEMVCTMIGFVREQPVPVEFRLAALAIVIMGIAVIVDLVKEYMG